LNKFSVINLLQKNDGGPQTSKSQLCGPRKKRVPIPAVVLLCTTNVHWVVYCLDCNSHIILFSFHLSFKVVKMLFIAILIMLHLRENQIMLFIFKFIKASMFAMFLNIASFLNQKFIFKRMLK